MHLKKWKELIECCNKGLEESDDSEFYNLKGRAEGKLGNMESKATLTKKAIELDSTVPAYYRNLGAALYKLEKYDEAI
jgi:tetratricopeptide (TPR) repeat protein